MNIKSKKFLILSIEVLCALLNFVFFDKWKDPSLLWFKSYANLFGLVSFIIGGIPIVYTSIKALFNKDLTADILFTIALFSELYLQDYLAVSILLIMMGAGEYLQEYTIDRAHYNLDTLINLIPTKVTRIKLLNDERAYEQILLNQIQIGDVLFVKSGERIAVDGIVMEGDAQIDFSSITGESIPIHVKKGDSVFSGGLILEGFVDIQCKTVKEESSMAKVIRLIKLAQEKKSPFQTLVNRWAQFFAPLIISIAIIAGLITQNLIIAVSILTVSCPCALVLSVPTAYIAALANASKYGIIIKSGDALEKMGKIDTIMLDKTGTLTTGMMNIHSIEFLQTKMTENEAIQIAASLEIFSNHPIAQSIIKTAQIKQISLKSVTNFENLKGMGVVGDLDPIHRYYLGNSLLLDTADLQMPLKISPEILKSIKDKMKKYEQEGYLSLILFQIDKPICIFAFDDELRPETREFIQNLQWLKINRIGILTGDSQARAYLLASALHIPPYDIHARLKPEDKYSIIDKEMGNNRLVAMVGDGINDAPSLAHATIGIAIGRGGTALAAEQAQVILMNDSLKVLLHAFYLGKRTIRKSFQNITLAIILNIIGIGLSIIGFFTPYMAAGWHIFQSILVVSNSLFLISDKLGYHI